jgi:hypothetical protein
MHIFTRLVLLVCGLIALGCTNTDPKKNLRQPYVEEFSIPPNDPKFSQPPTYDPLKREIGKPSDKKIQAPQVPGGSGRGGLGASSPGSIPGGPN